MQIHLAKTVLCHLFARWDEAAKTKTRVHCFMSLCRQAPVVLFSFFLLKRLMNILQRTSNGLIDLYV